MASLLEIKETIYAEYFPKVTRYVRSHVANRSDREDVVGDVFLKIYEKLDLYDERRASLSTWIYTVTKNTVIDYYKRRRPALPLPESLAEEASELDGDLTALADALERLGERERALIVLHYYSGYTLKSVAAQLNISYVYAKVLHKRSLQTLEKLMGG